ncbi:hypothetical protein [Halalkalibacter oceani]|nr:hypothetical protein [Halalkalibacter oceani]
MKRTKQQYGPVVNEQPEVLFIMPLPAAVPAVIQMQEDDWHAF